MMKSTMAGLPLLGVAALLATGLLAGGQAAARADAGLCRRLPGEARMLLRVERDTTLPFSPGGAEAMSMSRVPPGAADSLVATATTLMPAARVRILQLDSTTRAALAAHGVTAREPSVLIRAAPYRADCRTMRWVDTIPFVKRGEIGYVRATLLPRERWIDSSPVLVVEEVWSYPYPRRRGLAYNVAPDEPLASAEAMFGLDSALAMPLPADNESALAQADVKRGRAIAWARANPAAAELEPARALLRRAVLDPDWRVAARIPSRLRGTYRVAMESAGERYVWFFRTAESPGYSWARADSLQTTADLVASPHVAGYRLVGYAGASLDSLPTAPPTGLLRPALVWLSANDRPTTADDAARRTLTGILEFHLEGVPEPLWDQVERLVPRPSARDSAAIAHLNLPRGKKQPVVPLTLRLDASGGVRADTTVAAAGRSLRVVLERLDTLSLHRPF